MNHIEDYYKKKYLKYKQKYNIFKQNIFGLPLYDYNGVIAYSNNLSSYYANNELNYHNGNLTGIKWQCVEYARRYVQIVFDITFSQVESAYEIPNAVFTTLKDNKIIKPTITLNNIESNSLIIWSKDYKHDTPHGHVAIITLVNKEGIYVAEQNYNNDNHYRYIPYDDIKNTTIISINNN